MSAIKRLLYSGKTSNIILSILIVLYAIATFVENFYGTNIAKSLFYNNPLVYLIIILGIINMLFILKKGKFFSKKKIGTLAFHLSFVLILIGAITTNIFGYDGIMHIREGEAVNVISLSNNKNEKVTLPFNVKLNQFTVHRYAGSQSPSSYESELIITSENNSRKEFIEMNKVIHEQGYRLYQYSYDQDEQGTVLIVNYDPIGTCITYIGYILLFLGIVLVLFSKHSRFGKLRLELNKISALIIILLFSGFGYAYSLPANADINESNFLPAKEHADKFGNLLIQCSSGRLEPINTYSAKILRKICHKNSYKDYTAEQVLLSIILYPDFWNNIEILPVENQTIHEKLKTAGGNISYNAVFDAEGNYKLQEDVVRIYSKPNKERSKTDKDLLKLDERVNIIYSLQQGELLSIFPLADDAAKRWFSPGDDLSEFAGKDSMFVSKIFTWYLEELNQSIHTGDWAQSNNILDMVSTYQSSKSNLGAINNNKIKAELLYNKLNIFGKASIFYLAFSTFLLLFLFIRLFASNRAVKYLIGLCSFSIFLVFVFQTFGIGLRWYISGQAPWSNAYESMVYVGWSSVLAGLLFVRRSNLTFALSGLLAGFILLVSSFNYMDPEITPLVPVLKSPWLMFHVAVIMASYGFFGMSFFMSLFSMTSYFWKNQISYSKQLKELRIMNEISLIIGLCLLTMGTFLGAIWANESWGRYWGWDPKEVWALITMFVYTFVTHSHRVKALRSDFSYHAMTILAFSSVLMTYFGVNYYLSGLHSYGKTDSPFLLNLIYGIYIFIIILIMTAYKVKNRGQEKIQNTGSLNIDVSNIKV